MSEGAEDLVFSAAEAIARPLQTNHEDDHHLPLLPIALIHVSPRLTMKPWIPFCLGNQKTCESLQDAK